MALEDGQINDTATLDSLFRDAVAKIDAGDAAALARLLAAHPRLVQERLENPGPWAGDRGALEGFFQRPFLLWFVAEDPVRNGRLPKNIAEVVQVIIRAAREASPNNFQEQVDYTLRLVCWSWIARDCGVQIGLIDALIDAGASLDGRTVYEGRYGEHCDAAIYNRNYAAAEHLLKRGAAPTLTTALCLGCWEEVDRLAQAATLEEKQDAFVQSALNGKTEVLRRMLALGVDPTTVSARNQSHGTALHHAVWSGCLDAVKLLVEAGADPSRRDTIYNGTPLDWAKHAETGSSDETRRQQYREIAEYLAAQPTHDA